MPYIIKRSDITSPDIVIDDNTLNVSTSLDLVGRNKTDYGRVIAASQLHALENFANTSPPRNPIPGQLWYDKGVKSLKVNTSENDIVPDWKDLSVISVDVGSSGDPVDNLWATNISTVNFGTVSNPVTQAYVLNIGSPSRFVTQLFATNIGNSTNPVTQLFATNIGSSADLVDNILAINIGSASNPVTQSYFSQIGATSTPVTQIYASNIGSSTNLVTQMFVSNIGTGSVPITQMFATNIGNSTNPVNTIWTTNVGSASNPVTQSYFSQIGATSTPVTQIYASNIGTNSVKVSNIYVDNVYGGVFNGVSTSARYADLAERFESDKEYSYGTVVSLGGEKEITETIYENENKVFGVIAENPAYMMNSSAGTDKTHPYVALAGRVKTRVIGTVKKGDRLISSSVPGVATKENSSSSFYSVIGRALEDKIEEYESLIWVAVGAK